jgi:hypothetical protein
MGKHPQSTLQAVARRQGAGAGHVAILASARSAAGIETDKKKRTYSPGDVSVSWAIVPAARSPRLASRLPPPIPSPRLLPTVPPRPRPSAVSCISTCDPPCQQWLAGEGRVLAT